MSLNLYNTLYEATTELKERGFTTTFRFEDDHIINTSTNKAYYEDDLQIVEYHRFEMTNNVTNTIVFALETNKQEKGMILMNYSAQPNMNLISFIDKIKIKQVST